MDTSFQNLDDETRQDLADLLDSRAEYLTHQISVNRLRAIALRDPTPENLEAVEDYATEYVKPLREELAAQTHRLVEAAVDIDGLKAMLPAVLLALSQSINVPLLLTASGADPDMITLVVTEAQDYFRNGGS
jgi:CHAT domain-containing protein